MENNKLRKNSQNILAEIDSIIDQFILEVEELEMENEKLNERILVLENQLNNFK